MSTPPQPNFDRVARIYRWAEYAALGPILQRTRTHFLPQLTGCRNAFILGDGDGRFLACLLNPATNQIPQRLATNQAPQGFSLGSHRPATDRASAPGVCLPAPASELQALAVDTSSTMLQLLRTRCRNSPRLQTLQTSALDAPIPQATDLIVTHFFLDCLTQPQVDALTHRLAASTQPGTLWLLSDFAIPPNRLLNPFARLYIRALYLAFRILTNLRVTHLPHPQSALTQAGFTRIARHQRLFGLIYTEIWRHD